jgi:hypothetical protein
MLMSYPATVFSVMIASPGDVGAERAIVREVIAEWNAVHAKTRSIVLLPVGWETHSVPEMGAHPQEIINRQVLAQCDLLVGVFWTRIGTATPLHASGTVEEIEKHIESGKPTMLYFSSQPVALDSVDAAQYAKLTEFKASCQSRGLYATYDTTNDFRSVFSRQLQIILNGHPIFQSAVASSSVSRAAASDKREPELSPQAKQLLKSASRDEDGLILRMKMAPAGIILNTQRREFVATHVAREAALWSAAIEQLLAAGLIDNVKPNGAVMKVTASGYETADQIVD